MIPNKSEKAVLVNPFSFSNASILSISVNFNATKLLILIYVMLFTLLNNVKIKIKHYF
nr:MAG TPA: hypothetical protein [Caudoviricetes sp.]